MLKYKKYVFPSIGNGVEMLNDMLAGASGKNRRIVSLTGDIDSEIFFRVYKNADQIVDFECDLITTGAPMLPMDLPLVEGETAKVGFYNVNAGAVTPTVCIGYEES